MKSIVKVIAGIVGLIVITSGHIIAQKINEERMNRDIEVAENVLETLIKQKIGDGRMFFSLEVNGNYQEGYGVTFSLPPDYTTPIAFSMPAFDDGVKVYNLNGRTIHRAGDRHGYSSKVEEDEEDDDGDNGHDSDDDADWKLKIKEKQQKRSAKLDSLRDTYNDLVIQASTEFLADYGDLISQLTDAERIVITNRGERPKMWVGNVVNTSNRTHLAIELSRGAITQFKQGKLTRNQLIEKISIVDSEAVTDMDPDLELLSSIFNRLYRSDLSKTYFTEGNIYYERLKNFGAVYYMQVYSSNKTYNNMYDMPTIDKQNLSQADRDVKVKEMYPAFEKELKENILEYGRTVKSLGNDESLIFNVAVTKCADCGIPASLEVAIKSSVLKDYNAGKIDATGALSKMTIKKTAQKQQK